MLPRVAFLLALFSATGAAQFSGLSSTYDGSSLYFVSTLRLRDTQEPRNGKVFVASQEGVKLFRAHEREGVAPDTRPCGLSGFRDYTGVETSRNGSIALQYAADALGGCSYPINTAMSQLVTPAAETVFQGVMYLSPGGRYAFNFLALTARPWDSFTISLIDLQTGVKTILKAPTISFPDSVSLPYAGRRVADDGTSIIGVVTAGNNNSLRGFLLKPDSDPQFFAGGVPMAIDAAAAHVLYQGLAGVALFDQRTGEGTLLKSASTSAYNFRMSDDARRVAYILDNQVHVIDTATLVDRALTTDAAGISDLAISGDGRIVHAVTRAGRLLKIDAASGTVLELIGRTPFLASPVPLLQAGLVATLNGGGLADAQYDNHPPYPAWAGTLTMWIGERKVPVISLTPDRVTFLVPWDIQADNGTIRIQAEVAGEHSPFYYPELETTLYPEIGPQAGAVTHANWEQFYVGPVSPGEIIHVFALGFGPVLPEPPEGGAAPAAEPFARLAQPLACSNLEVLYAGLMPFTVQRIYQLDLRIGPKTGYQQFICTLGNSQPFIFLTLNVVQ